MTTRRLLAATTTLLLSLLVLAPPAAEAAPHRAQARLSISPRAPIRHERLDIHGHVPGGSRPLQLQRRTPHGWTRVSSARSSAQGLFTVLHQHAGRSVATYRVLAPAHRGDPAVHTPTRTVRPVQEHLAVTVPPTAETGTPVEASIRLTPARTGRKIHLQERQGGAWATVASRRVTGPGVQTLQTGPTVAGPLQLRVVADERRGAPSLVTKADVVTVSDPVPGAVSDLAAAPLVTSITLTWSPNGPNYSGATVRRGPASAPPATPTDGVAVATSAVDHVDDVGLAPSTTYTYTVFPHNAATPTGYGPPSTIEVTTTAPTWGAAETLPSAASAPTTAPHIWVSVSCPSEQSCTAVNVDGSVSRYDGVAWSTAELIGNGEPTSVSCPTSGFCAVFGSGVAWTWDGTVWNAAPLTSTGGWYSVSCASATFCVAVDSGSDAFTWDGSSWSAPTDYRPPAEVGPNDSDVDTVDCPTTTFCVVAGPQGVVHTFDGTTWSDAVTIGDVTGLYGISCASATLCVATAQAEGEAFVWDGTTWSAPATLRGADPAADHELYADSCTSADACVVANLSGDAWWLQDGSWVQASSPVPVAPEAVSCPTSTFCAATGSSKVSVYR